MYEEVIGQICRVVGVVPAQLAQEKYKALAQSKGVLLEQHVKNETDANTQAYMFIEILFRSQFVRTTWPTDKGPSNRDVRNKFRALCTQSSSPSANGWGFDKTFNPQTQGGTGKPMFVHGFSIFKEVSATDVGWAPFILPAPAFTQDCVLARPALRMLNDPLCVQNLPLSTSLIGHDKCATASPVGYIINVPVWNLFGLAPKDIQFPNDEMMKAKQTGAVYTGIQARENNQSLAAALQAYPSPSTLVDKTVGTGGESNYNELVLLGTSALFSTKIKVTGIYVKVATKASKLCIVDASLGGWLGDETARFYKDNKVVQGIRTCSTKHNLPVVAVIDEQMQGRATDMQFDQAFANLTVRKDWKA